MMCTLSPEADHHLRSLALHYSVLADDRVHRDHDPMTSEVSILGTLLVVLIPHVP